MTTGIGVGEVLAVTWADVSFTLKRIRVLMEKESAPETRNKIRYIPINERQRIYMKKLASLPTVYVANGKPKPASRCAFREAFHVVLQELNLPKMPISDLRRTFAVHCLENGMGYEELSKILGQKNGRNFRVIWQDLVSAETRERLEQETLAARKIRQAPEPGPVPGGCRTQTEGGSEEEAAQRDTCYVGRRHGDHPHAPEQRRPRSRPR